MHGTLLFLALCTIICSSQRLLPGLVSSPEPSEQITTLTGCTYRIRGNETLAFLAASLDVDMDTLANLQSQDVTSPNFFSSNTGKDISVPCPGRERNRFFPLYVAGCFFDYTIPSGGLSLRQLSHNPPADIPGPLTITGIWTANFQSSGLDLTSPNNFKAGRQISIPTCGHLNQINPAQVPRSKVSGCSFSAPTILISQPIKLWQLTTLLGADVGQLQQLNPGKGLTADTVVLRPGQTVSAGRTDSNNTMSVSDLGRISIPCPTFH